MIKSLDTDKFGEKSAVIVPETPVLNVQLTKCSMDMLNRLKSTVGGLIGNPVTREFDVGPHIASAGPGHLWRIYEGTKKTTKQKVSLFYLEKKYLDKFARKDREKLLETLKIGPTKLTKLRHPNLLVVEHPLEESRESLAFATEPVFASLSNLLGCREGMPSPVPQVVTDHELYEVEIKYGLLQLTEALKFLHNNVKMIHGNICPENVILNANGAWKLAGFDFFIQSSNPPDQPAQFSVREWEDDVTPVAQPNLNFFAPEYILTLNCDTASDLFSLGMLMYATVNKGKVLYDNNENVRTFKQNVSQLKALNFTSLGSLPEGLKEYVKMLLSATPTVRPDADQLSKIPYFDDVGAMTLQYLDTLFQQENIQKSKFFKGLPKILSKLPKRVVLQRVLPCLCKEFYNPDMIPFVLPNVLLITEMCTNEEYVRLVLPELIPVFKLQEPVQISLIFMQRMDLLLTKTPKEDVKHHVLPMVYRALEAPSPQIQELCLTILPTFASMIEQSSMKHAIIPRIKKLCLETDRLSTRVGCLVCIGKMLEHMDKWFVLDEVLPMLMQIPSREPAVLMGILGIMKMTVTHKKLGITKDIAATKVLPFLFPLCIDNGLNLSQFNAFMAIIKQLVSQVENDHRGKLEQLNSLQEEQKTSLQFAQDIQEDKTPTADPFSALEKKPVPSTKSSGEVDDMFQSLGLQSYISSSSEKLRAANEGTSDSSSSSAPPTKKIGGIPSQPAQVSLSLEEKQRLQNEQEFQQRIKHQKPIAAASTVGPTGPKKAEPKDLTNSLLDSTINRQVNSVSQPVYNSSSIMSSNSSMGVSPSMKQRYNSNVGMTQPMTPSMGQSQGYNSYGSSSQVGMTKPKVDMSAFDSLLETPSSRAKPSLNQMGNTQRSGSSPGQMPFTSGRPGQSMMGMQQPQMPMARQQYQPMGGGIPTTGQFAMYGNTNQGQQSGGTLQSSQMSSGFDPLKPSPAASKSSSISNKGDNLLDFLG